MKNNIKTYNEFIFENINKYYTTSFPMTINDFIEIEVNERENYDIDEVHKWIKKYNIDYNDEIIWIATTPHDAARYEMCAEDWNNAEEIYNNNPDEFNVEVINSNLGFIIPETNDGDNGFLFVFK